MRKFRMYTLPEMVIQYEKQKKAPRRNKIKNLDRRAAFSA